MATILVVDDNVSNRSVLTTLLGYGEHRIVEASSGREAIDKTKVEHPDLIITDILMPNMDGYELVQNLRALNDDKQAQIIFYSATYLEGEAQALARACGVSRVVCKPAEPEHMLKIIEEALAQGRLMEGQPAPESPIHVDAIRILNDKLYRKVMEVEELNDSLEKRVAERTFDLEKANRALKVEILERQKAEADAIRNREEMLKIKGEFLSHVSHELRSPLAVVYQFTTILVDGLAGSLGPSQREYLEIILRNVNQLKYMIDDLLEASRGETGKLAVRRSPISIIEVVAQALRSFAEAAREKGITLKADSQREIPRVHADSARIIQVLSNLIDNAIKFSPPNAAVTVRTGIFADDPNLVCVSVSDCGCGIEPDDVDKVFRRLYQSKNTISESRKGLGLGLYICKELVELHSGTIWVDTKCRAGATFHFTLPIFAIKNMIGPIVVQDGRVVPSLALLNIELRPASPWRTAQDRERRVHTLQQVVEGCLLADLDVLLPVQNFGMSDVFTIVARTDVHGGNVILSRFRNQLSRRPELNEAGLTCLADCEVLDLQSLAGVDMPLEERISQVAAMIEECLKSSIPKGATSDDRKENTTRGR